MQKGMIELTDANFSSEVLSSELPVLVDFWASWCGPCKALAPTIDEVAAAYQGKVKVAKLNVDDNTDTATRYSIMSIPTLAFFNKGKLINTTVGVVSKGEIENKLKEIIS